MIKVSRNPVGVVNILFSTDKQAVAAKEQMSTDFAVQKKWEKQIRVTATDDCTEKVNGIVESVFRRACALPGFKQLEVSITQSADIFQSESNEA